MDEAFTIRPAVESDVPRLLEIYAPLVESSTVSFELQAPEIEEFSGRVRRSLQRWQWLVAESEEGVIGYAYGGSHRERAAYRYSVEVSAYVAEEARRRGVAKALYGRLLPELESLGYCNAYAGVTLPNDPSVALHTAVGFEPLGVFRKVGWKFGAWHDVQWFQIALRSHPLEGG